MASPRAPKAPPAATALEDCLAEARAGRPAPVYLLEGDAFLAGRAARALAEARDLAWKIVQGMGPQTRAEVVLAPPYTALATVASAASCSAGVR